MMFVVVYDWLLFRRLRSVVIAAEVELIHLIFVK